MTDDELAGGCDGCLTMLALILICVMLWQMRGHVIAIRNYLVPVPPDAGANNGDTGSTGSR